MNRKEVLEMAYTLAMATGKGIETADDGVATVGMTDARALLTSLIREVRYGGKVGAFTERGARQAYVVTPAFYEQAAGDAATLEALRERIQELEAGDKPDAKSHARILSEALAAAEGRPEDPDFTPKTRKVVLRRKK
ncbi:hypothetical protein G6W57_01095 [Streptomyces sp. CAI-121]|uniref:hypothetical protein n=1 Tax=unclassified Streptomyces TaxID=2593676 RepID=UPI0015876337|nr:MULTISPECIES: hypothetical protein [unclassified Streptomyces]NUV65711.1 hypothetical protein [Streptomyces sp. CAI-121]NUW12448.1 hypothetical protein [Streptomyces sp. CAI-68]